MGCWNKTCGITQTPIMCGDKVVSYLIVESGLKTDPTPSYHNTNWDCIPIPFFGTYDDYGWFDLDPGQEYKFEYLKNHFKDSIINLETDTAIKWDQEQNIRNPFTSSEDYCEAMRDQKVGLLNIYKALTKTNKHCSFSVFMMHRLVYDRMTSHFEQDYPEQKIWSRGEIANTVNEYLEYRDHHNAERFKDLPHDVRAAISRLNQDDDVLSEFFKVKYNINSLYNNPVAAVIRSMKGRHVGVIQPNELHLDGITSTDDLVEHWLFIHAMNNMRKTFHPQGHEGSQDGFNHHHKILAQTILDLMQLDAERYAEDEDE